MSFILSAAAGDRGLVRRCLAYFLPHRPVLALVTLTMVVVGLADTVVALAAKLMMDLFTAVSNSAGSGAPLSVHLAPKLAGGTLFDLPVTGLSEVRTWLVAIPLATIALVLVRGGFHFLKEYLIWRVTYRILTQIKGEIFHAVVHLPLVYTDRNRSGEVLSRVTYDVSQLETSLHSAFILTKSLVYAVIFLAAMFLLAPLLTVVALSVFPLSALLIKAFGDRIRRVSRVISQNVSDYTSFLSEVLGGAKVIKAFGRERDQEAAFTTKIRENYRYSMKVAKYATLHSPAQELISAAGMAVVMLFCGFRLLAGAMTIGDLTAFVVLLVNAYKPVKTLGEVNAVLQRALASARRIFSLLDEPPEPAVVGSGTLKPSPVRGEIRIRNLTFGYDSGPSVLKDISLDIPAGKTVALVGPSGSGKSTLVSLLPRFYPVAAGTIFLDGVDLNRWDLEYLRSQFAVVPQETILFSGTVADNLRLGKPDATDSELVAAAEAAHAHDFIVALPGGYGAEVGERGAQLSGGERQRLALARAILRNPRILLLDEATSSLDSESERFIQQALDQFRQGRTTVIIAHRLSTVKSADSIAVLDGGRIVEQGTHDELVSRDGLYHRLCVGQLLA